MLCEICNKNHAIVHSLEIIDTKIIEHHLCNECAKKKGVGMLSFDDKSMFEDSVPDFLNLKKEEISSKIYVIKCNSCGMSFIEFKKHGIVGCKECYNVFEKKINYLLKKIHGNVRHNGKVPTKVPKEGKVKVMEKKNNILQDLNCALQKAVDEERYEDASEIRDKIKLIEKDRLEKNNRIFSNEDR